MIISIDAEKAFDKIQHAFFFSACIFDRNSLERGHRGYMPQHNKGQMPQTYN